ncbi:YbeD family protein [Thauera sinica]|uniref:YbeD family protein n=1 Tax=Thauera sinica TaxID=2665146 RepID=A0ABW1ARU5_9RHOO
MGARVDGFAQAVLDVVLVHAPDFEAATMEMRPSSKGNYLAITCTFRAVSQEQIDNLYRALTSHPMVKVVL